MVSGFVLYRLRFDYAATGRSCIEIEVTHANHITMGDIMRILYREQTGIDPGAEIVVVGFRSCRLLSLHVGRFVWRPARLLKQRVWHGVPKRGRQHLSLERHCMKCKRPKPKQPKASATLVFHEVLEYINNQFYGLGFCV